MGQGRPETRAGGCGTEVVTVSGHIVDERRTAAPAPTRAGARPAENPSGAELPSGSFLGSTVCAASPSSPSWPSTPDSASVNGGLLGVDMFFVLSGFLVTSLLLAEHARTGTIKLRAFWARRARRLLPALFVLLVGRLRLRPLGRRRRSARPAPR